MFKYREEEGLLKPSECRHMEEGVIAKSVHDK